MASFWYMVFFTLLASPLLFPLASPLVHAAAESQRPDERHLFDIPFLHGFHACNLVDCGHGDCVNSTDAPWYSCSCNDGWATPFNRHFLPCVIPNCTINRVCSDQPPSERDLSPAPAPSDPSFNLGRLDACDFPVCGKGRCVPDSNGTGLLSYSCDCDPGYLNMFNSSKGYCLRDCQLGADCDDLNIRIRGNSSDTPSQASSSTALNSPPSPSTSPSSSGTRQKWLSVLLFPLAIFLTTPLIWR